MRAATAGGETRRFFGDLVEARDGADIYYYYAGPIRVAMKDTTGARTWYHHDHLGSVRLRTDEEGLEVESADYKPFGELWSASGEAGESPWDFAGHRTDADSGLVYMNARYYDPEIGRFLTADPVVADPKDPQSLNRYAYANNNPISNVDPTGHFSESGGGGLGFLNFFRVLISALDRWDRSPGWNRGPPSGPSSVGTVGGLGARAPGLAALARLMLGFGSGYRQFWGSGVLGVGLTSPEATVAVGWAWGSGDGYLQKAWDVVRALGRLLGARDAEAAAELSKVPKASNRTAKSQVDAHPTSEPGNDLRVGPEHLAEIAKQIAGLTLEELEELDRSLPEEIQGKVELLRLQRGLLAVKSLAAELLVPPFSDADPFNVEGVKEDIKRTEFERDRLILKRRVVHEEIRERRLGQQIGGGPGP